MIRAVRPATAANLRLGSSFVHARLPGQASLSRWAAASGSSVSAFRGEVLDSFSVDYARGACSTSRLHQSCESWRRAYSKCSANESPSTYCEPEGLGDIGSQRAMRTLRLAAPPTRLCHHLRPPHHLSTSEKLGMTERGSYMLLLYFPSPRKVYGSEARRRRSPHLSLLSAHLRITRGASTPAPTLSGRCQVHHRK